VQINGDGDRSQRPLGVDQDQLLQTIEELLAGDRLVVSELSRLGRSLGQIIQAVDQMLKKGVGLVAIKGSIRLEGEQDLQTKVTIALFGLFTEIERDLISERTKEGLAAARARGHSLGRPKGSPRPVEARREAGRDSDADGPAGFQGVDRQDPGGRPEHAALLHLIAPPRTQELSASMRGVLAPIGAVP
jgi:DNA invertase Pin-like site-specific DNA recombinase